MHIRVSEATHNAHRRLMSRPAIPIVDIDIADELDARLMLSVLAQVKAGDFSARMPLDWTGVAGKVADDLNEIIIANQAVAS
ncbi:MAG: hypothetical protein H0U05_03825, partial [Actinobacteria bacterium]|nr:hypothetical protein [Actinomycetota bacterium]